MPSQLRTSVERASLPALARIAALPRAVPFLVMMVLLVGGALLRAWGGFVLVMIAVLIVGWLLYLSWPQLTTSQRLGRVAVLLLVVAVALVQLFPTS